MTKRERVRHFFLLVAFLLGAGCKKEPLINPESNQRVSATSVILKEHIAPVVQAPVVATVSDSDQYRQLFIQDIRPGDIMLKVVHYHQTYSRRIERAQRWLGFENHCVTHVGVMKDQVNIIESESSGLEQHSLLEKRAKIAYLVYRPTNSMMAEAGAAAATLFYEAHMAQNTVRYNYWDLFPSVLFWPGKPKSAKEMQDVYDNIMHGKNHSMFCSQFVAFVYQWVGTQMGIPAEQIFNADDKRIPPARLATFLQSNPHFKEVGYMIGNER